MVLVGLAGIGAGALLLAGGPYAAATVAATFVIGLSVSAVIVPAQTVLQAETPAGLTGRVSSTSMAVLVVGQLLGLVTSSVLTGLVGITTVFVLSAILALALAAAGRMFLPASMSGPSAVPATPGSRV
jgi:hypothetical protein